MDTDDETIDAIRDACDEYGLDLNMDNDHTQLWIGALRLAESRSSAAIQREIEDHSEEMRDEEVITRKLACVLDETFQLGMPRGTLVFNGP